VIIATVLELLLGTLLITEILELLVAIPFRIGRRGMVAVALVNVVTNPLFNFAIFALIWSSTPGRGSDYSDYTAISPVAMPLEIVVIVAEWRLLIWSLRSTAGGPGKLLGLSVAMNTVSAIVGLPMWVR
jgi:hypothetical protein